MRRTVLFLLTPIAALAGCADLLGVVTLSGTDAGATDATVNPAPPADAGCQNLWVDASGGAFPLGAMPNEPQDSSGFSTYVCRVASAANGLVPGKLLAGYYCYYGDGQSEQHASDYQVLVPANCPLAWAAAPGGVPKGDPLPCGADPEGGSLFCCRVAGSTDPGELGHEGASTGFTCIYSLSGESLTGDTFDVLTLQ